MLTQQLKLAATKIVSIYNHLHLYIEANIRRFLAAGNDQVFEIICVVVFHYIFEYLLKFGKYLGHKVVEKVQSKSIFKSLKFSKIMSYLRCPSGTEPTDFGYCVENVKIKEYLDQQAKNERIRDLLRKSKVNSHQFGQSQSQSSHEKSKFFNHFNLLNKNLNHSAISTTYIFLWTVTIIYMLFLYRSYRQIRRQINRRETMSARQRNLERRRRLNLIPPAG